jgi:hypothetical protein
LSDRGVTAILTRMRGTRKRSKVPAVVAGVGTGLLVVLLLLPVSGIDTNPPVCYATFDYTVPCGSGLAFGAALVVGMIVGGVTYRAWGRRSR